jgi:hypothetical protein
VVDEAEQGTSRSSSSAGIALMAFSDFRPLGCPHSP